MANSRKHLALVTLAACSFFGAVVSTGASFHRYLGGFLHGKVMLIDDSAATVGSANFDNRSFPLNFEITTVVVEQAFAAAVEAMFEGEFSRSRRMEAGEFDNKNYLFRVAARLVRLASPIL